MGTESAAGGSHSQRPYDSAACLCIKNYTVHAQKQYVAYSEICHFLCSVISQNKVVALDR